MISIFSVLIDTRPGKWERQIEIEANRTSAQPDLSLTQVLLENLDKLLLEGQ